jgi:hypothetical protein
LGSRSAFSRAAVGCHGVNNTGRRSDYKRTLPVHQQQQARHPGARQQAAKRNACPLDPKTSDKWCRRGQCQMRASRRDGPVTQGRSAGRPAQWSRAEQRTAPRPAAHSSNPAWLTRMAPKRVTVAPAAAASTLALHHGEAGQRADTLSATYMTTGAMTGTAAPSTPWPGLQLPPPMQARLFHRVSPRKSR